MSSPILVELETFYGALQRLNRALALADTQSIFSLVGEIGEKSRGLEQLDYRALSLEDKEQAKKMAGKIRSIQDANHTLSNNGLRTARWCSQLMQPQPGYAADGTMPQAPAGINLSA